MSDKLRWGILGPGRISAVILNDLRLAGIQVDAVGSKSLDRAKAYALQHQVEKAYGSYEDLVADPELDVIYVSTTNNVHFENAKLALEAGKHVLLEKPFTLDANQASALVRVAREKKRFLMEAMWTRFLPNHVALFDKLNAGIIGNPLYLFADHNQLLPKERSPRLYDPSLGGGSLLDLGVYPISLAHRVFGAPIAVKSSASLMEGNIDESFGAILDYTAGRQALVHSSIRVNGPVRAFILGDKGRVELDKSFFQFGPFSIFDQQDNLVFRFEGNIEGRGMQYQALELERCVFAGLLESPTMSLDETVEIMKVMDQIRLQSGIEYPGA
jgi:predicted dehydrogenase